jgi:glyoxylase-like metal-dependent hydrolase (beta-lactamase superfamily II)
MRLAPLALLVLVTSCAHEGNVPSAGPVSPSSAVAPAPLAPARPTAATSAAFAYDVVKVGDGVYAFAMRENKGSLVSGNTLVVVGDDGVLVVDTTHFPSLARKMIGDVRKLTDKPVRYVVNTHWHPDHLSGNAVYRAAFPGVSIVSHAETRRMAALYDPKYFATQQHIDKAAERYRGFLASGKMPDGSPMTPGGRAEGETTLAEVEQTIGDTDVTLDLPDTTFDGSEMSVRLGKREVKLLHFGRGNTAGDVAVYVPDAKVVATGDIVVGPTPYAYGSYLGEWVECLRKLEATGATTVVPGHGPIAHDFAYVKALTAMIESVRAQSATLAKAGVKVEDAQKQVDVTAEEKAFAGDDLLRRYELRDAFVKPAVERGVQEALGKWADED